MSGHHWLASAARVAALSGMLVAAVAGTHRSAAAEDAASFPTRTVTIVVQAVAGGGNDAVARMLASQMQKRLGHPVIIENRGGGGGAVGSEYVARSKPDGYTLLLLTTGETYYKTLNSAVRFDTVADFAPITMVASVPLLLVSRSSQPFKSFSEFIASAKLNPKKLTYGTAGVGSPHHLAGEMLNKAAGIDVVHVPYRGTAPAITDLLSGQIDLAWSSPAAVKPHIDAGTLQPLVVADQKRAAALPQTPTIIESGYPEVSFDLWFGIVGPRGVPDQLVKRIDTVVRESASDPDMVRRLGEIGFQSALEGPDDFAARIKADQARYTKAIQDLGLAK